MNRPRLERQTAWQQYLQRCKNRAQQYTSSPVVEGRITRVVGLTLEAVGVQAAIGELCHIIGSDGRRVEAEVVGFADSRLYLMPTDDIQGITQQARVVPTGRAYQAAVGPDLLGRVLDGTGKPIDDLGPLYASEFMPLSGKPINPLSRQPISDQLDVGIRSINSLLSVGRGQRLGLFAGSGVGKSVLLGMMTRYTSADVVVVGLIGERGREVKDFIERILQEDGMAKAVVVAAPSDTPPVMRLHGAALATSIAEYYRDQGKHVLLLMDSLTRYAQAQREIALAIGEPPATKGYPPSVFSRIPKLVERAGNGMPGKGSITAFYTVLTEGDDQQDPIADAARAVLDGHIVLSRRLADGGIYPAIDIESSISRLMTDIVSPEHLVIARHFKKMYSLYQQSSDLINVGAYTAGSNRELDQAISLYPGMVRFLEQDMFQSIGLMQSLHDLTSLFQVSEPAPAVSQNRTAVQPGTG